MSSGFPPTAFLVGAQKCATSFLADALAAHPDVCLAMPKEPNFFTVNREKGTQWYRACFATPDAPVLLDASPSYSFAPTRPERQTAANPAYGVPGRIAAFSPSARILYVVRDPVKRTYSAYWHEVRTGYEDRPFLDAIDRRDTYLDASRYHFQVSQYLATFGPERVLVLDMGEVAGDPAAACRRAWRFLGLDAEKGAAIDPRPRNTGYQYTGLGNLIFRNPVVRKTTKPLARTAARLLPRAVYEPLRRSVTREIPPMREAERDVVLDRLAEDMAAFARLTGIDYRREAETRASGAGTVMPAAYDPSC